MSNDLLYPNNNYALKVGQLTIGWNTLQTAMLFWFDKLLASQNYKTSKDLWECGMGDKQQRNMLRSLIKNNEIPQKDDLLWVIAKADLLSNYRNALIHTPVTWDETSVFAFRGGSKIKNADRVKQIQDNDQLDSLINDIGLLESYLLDAFKSTPSDSSEPWPQRPSLTITPDPQSDNKDQTGN